MRPTQRVVAPTDANGQRLSYSQRKSIRVDADNQRRAEQREQKAAAKREAELNPPPAPLPFAQRQALRQSQDQGRKDAEAKAQREAAEKAGPVNPFRQRAAELESQLYLPRIRSKYEHFLNLASRWDQEQLAAKQAAEQRAAVDADPQVKTARDYAAGLVKLAPSEFASEASEINGIALAGDAKLAWERMRDLEQRIWTYQDKLAAEKLIGKNEREQEFREAASKALEARERAEHSANIANELGGNDG